MNEGETTCPNVIQAAATERRDVLFYSDDRPGMHQEASLFWRMQQEGNYFLWKKYITLMLSAKASLSCEISQEFDIFATEKTRACYRNREFGNKEVEENLS